MARRKKILIVSGNGPGTFDGIANYTHNLIEAIGRADPDLQIVWLAKRARLMDTDVINTGKYTIVMPHHSWHRPYRWIATAVSKMIRPDVIHVQDEIHSYFETPAACELLSWSSGKKIVTIHEYHEELDSTRWTKRAIEQADIVLSSDHKVATVSNHHTGRSVDRVLWSPANIRPNARELATPIRGVCTTFGLISGIKGLEMVYEALSLARRSIPDIRWQIIGPWDPVANHHHKYLSSKVTADWVEFLGGFHDPDDDRMISAIQESDLFLLPFLDGASLRRTTLHTAWAFGIPTITTKSAYLDPEIRHRNNVVFVERNQPQAWADAIRNLIQDSELKATLSTQGLQTAERLSWRNLAHIHADMYQRLT